VTPGWGLVPRLIPGLTRGVGGLFPASDNRPTLVRVVMVVVAGPTALLHSK